MHTQIVHSGNAPLCFPIEKGLLEFWSNWLTVNSAQIIQKALMSKLKLRQGKIKIGTKCHAIPRLQAWYADPGVRYTYSRTTLSPMPWLPLLKSLKMAVEKTCYLRFNSVLISLYQSGCDSVAWHADDEPELGYEPQIASLSFGARRRFVLKHKERKQQRLELSLGQGDLLIMAGPTQRHWYHQVPKTARFVKPRLNLTFRLCRTEYE